MKICSKCKIVKDNSNFYSNGISGLRAMCKTCMTPLEKIRKQEINERIRSLIVSEKNRPCMDCGGLFNPWQMDFDHRDATTKIDAIGTMLVKKASFGKVIKEIAKCDLVCANCHRNRTHKRYKDVKSK